MLMHKKSMILPLENFTFSNLSPFQKALQECETEWSQNKKVVDISQRDIRHAVRILSLSVNLCLVMS